MSYRSHALVLAIYPSTRGIAFVLFEGPLSPVDWGVKEMRGAGKNALCLLAVGDLLERYELGIVILQDTSSPGTQRSQRIKDLNTAITELAASYGFETIAFSRAEIIQTFAKNGAMTKQTIAETVAAHIPAFRRYLPPVRRPWMSEDSRMALFDAAALGLTFFQSPSGGQEQVA
jgi:hypothetical protein